MSKKSKFVLLAFMLALMMGLLPGAIASAANTLVARVRVAHFSPDAPPVQIFLNGQPSGIQTLSFGNISGWVEIPAGTYSVAVVPAGAPLDQAAIGPVSLGFRAGSWTTVAAIGSLASGSLTATTIAEDYRPLNASDVRVTVFHGIEDAPAVDVILPDGTKVVSNLSFGRSATVTVPANVYDLRVVPAGAASPVVINLAGTKLAGSTYYFVAATNRLASPKVALAAISLKTVAPLIRDSAATQTIVQIAVADSRFTTLVTALKAAGLVDTLNGAGPFTVFAPTNAAFAKLPAGTLEAVLADKKLLTSILLYHVTGGKLLASDVVNLSGIDTLNGRVSVTVNKDGVFLNGNVKVIITDIQATNGVIHVIDSVLIP
jgi:uncharacterized surface protein with fasciclin (FAS1) repeats